MRALAVDPDVVVVVSAMWQTTCTAIRSGEEGFLIDSPVLPDELDALPSLMEQAGFPISGLLVTHGDWDHLLGRLAFPEATLGAGEPTARRLAAEPGAAQRALRAFDEEHYVEGPRPLGLAGVQALPVPGKLSIGADAAELELHPGGGHSEDGTIFWLPWLSVLICGDYLSPVEIPMVGERGSVGDYVETLKQLSGLVERAATVIPGHGSPLDGEAARRILEEDVKYMRAIVEGGDAPLPEGRRSPRQREIHAANLASVR
ncbi:MAG TPA: MBL fold metallo-hydrolase [Solirubrobacteraceae bacterium]|jgi:glyoxylase-like metal-dependent hydrolase (beta-lactamase superfamily II)